MSLETILRETDAVPPPTAQTVARARAALDGATDAAAMRVRAIRRARRRRVGLSALVGAAATAALVIAPTIIGGDQGPTASAAQVLLAASEASGEQGDGWPDANYWHTVTEYTTVVAGEETAADRRESWMGHETDSVVLLSLEDQLVWTLPWQGMLAGQVVTWDDLYALPTDPDALEQLLREGAATEQAGLSAEEGGELSQDVYVFRRIGDLLRDSPASPTLRQGLWAVAARLPEVTLVGDVTDAAGRPGIAVELGGVRLVIDPADGRLLEWWTYGRSATGEATEAFIRETYIEQGPTDAVQQPASRVPSPSPAP